MTKSELIAKILGDEIEAYDTDAIYKDFTKAELQAIWDEGPHQGWTAPFDEFLVDEDDESTHKMARTLNQYRPRYVDCIAASGRKSKNTGDDLAALLSDMDHNEVAALATKVLDLDEDLIERYGHLNHGQIRMNCGNRLRAAVKRGDLTVDQIAGSLS